MTSSAWSWTCWSRCRSAPGSLHAHTSGLHTPQFAARFLHWSRWNLQVTSGGRKQGGLRGPARFPARSLGGFTFSLCKVVGEGSAVEVHWVPGCFRGVLRAFGSEKSVLPGNSPWEGEGQQRGWPHHPAGPHVGGTYTCPLHLGIAAQFTRWSAGVSHPTPTLGVVGEPGSVGRHCAWWRNCAK